jgi:hypothetical protein
MKQSRFMSLVEALANVVVGYGVAVVTQIPVFPIFGLHTTLAQNLRACCSHSDSGFPWRLICDSLCL